MQAPVAIGVINRAGLEVAQANAGYRQLVARGSGCERERLAEVFASGRPLVEHELLVRGEGDDDDRHWTVTYAPLCDAEGATASVLVIGQDVTPLVARRKRVETSARQLRNRLREAQERVRRIETFTGMVAHDLRTPLAAMVLTAQTIQMSPTAREHDSALDRIVRAGTRMRGLITLLLDFTRVGIGLGLPLRRRAADMREVVRQAVDELEERYPQRIAVASVGDVEGEWDVERLTEVVSNLLTNALVHGAPDGVVALMIDGSHPDSIELRVHNQGSIADGARASIFDPFQRSTSVEDGLGLGLFICKQIAVAHGGDIRLESSKRAGTQFRLRLPRRVPTATLRMAARAAVAEKR